MVNFYRFKSYNQRLEPLEPLNVYTFSNFAMFCYCSQYWNKESLRTKRIIVTITVSNGHILGLLRAVLIK